MNRIDVKYIEGHAVYVEIECMRKLGQERYADFDERCVMAQNDVYTEGLKYWRAHMMTEPEKNIFVHMKKL